MLGSPAVKAVRPAIEGLGCAYFYWPFRLPARSRKSDLMSEGHQQHRNSADIEGNPHGFRRPFRNCGGHTGAFCTG
jgi:hypothetical protein